MPKKCSEKGCCKAASYNYKDETKPILCGYHKNENMVNVKDGYCLDCGLNASFNYTWIKRPIYCSKHKKENMVNIRARRCIQNGCDHIPSYNFKGETSLYCSSHKLHGMINLKSKICIIEGCDKPAYFRNTNDFKNSFCTDHKINGMVSSSINKLCKFEGCYKRANFNFEGMTKGEYCKFHSITGMVDVKHYKCKICKTSAFFNIPDKSPEYCATCKTSGMIFRPTKRCNIKDCNETAIYGYRDHIVCEKHKIEDMINFIERKCKSCGLFEILDEDNTCKNCNPESSIKIRKKKESEIKFFLHQNSFEYISYDKRIRNIEGSDLLVKPDFLFKGGNDNYYVILEVDEFQHQTYDNCCEVIRMKNISEVLMKPTIFIRYNPDNFKVDNILRDVSITYRWRLLKQWLEKSLNLNDSEIEEKGHLSCVKLFYDNFDEKNISYEIIVK